MSESENDNAKVYFTEDGKTVFMDPKTDQTTVFESSPPGSITPPSTEVTAIMHGSLIPSIWAYFPTQLVVQPLTSLPAAMQLYLDPLGPEEYYILAPAEHSSLFPGPVAIRMWVIEHTKGYKPDYAGLTKHRILKEQHEFLQTHKDCSIVAWYDFQCPAYASVACQAHSLLIKPVSDKMDHETKDMYVEKSSIKFQEESIWAEEREI